MKRGLLCMLLACGNAFAVSPGFYFSAGAGMLGNDPVLSLESGYQSRGRLGLFLGSSHTTGEHGESFLFYGGPSLQLDRPGGLDIHYRFYGGLVMTIPASELSGDTVYVPLFAQALVAGYPVTKGVRTHIDLAFNVVTVQRQVLTFPEVKAGVRFDL